ncbi:MAG: NAD(+)/NADH kinase [Thermoplasmata archaeon]
MKIGITANPYKPAALDGARRVASVIKDRAEIVWSEETYLKLGATGSMSPLEDMDVDALIALGGDGTFLTTLQHTELPLLPVNAGTVGFLAEIDAGQLTALDEAIERLLQGRYILDRRMKIGTQFRGQNLSDATNEVVVHTNQIAKMRNFEIAIDGNIIGRVRGDGVILATPTGSTSYSLSALGPIIDPTIDGILLTMLAPYQTTQRAVLLDPLRSVSVRLMDPDKGGAVVIDGQSEAEIPGGERILVYRSPRRASFIRFAFSFFQQLRGKKILPWSEETGETKGAVHADLPPPA